MPVQIKEVTNRRDLRRFVDFPNHLYQDSLFYVPALIFDDMNTYRWDKNAAFEHCEARYWLAYRDGKVVGRIGGIINRLHAEKWNQPYMRFTAFDFIDDQEVSRALMDQVEAWARQQHLSAVHGPLGFTDMDREGMLVEGFDEVGTLATYYNHAYYPRHMQAMGYAKDIDWMEFELSVPDKVDPMITRVAETAKRRYNLHLLQAKNKKDLLPYVTKIFALLDVGYAHLYGTVPLTPRQVQAYKEQYFGFIKPEYVPIVVNENDDVVGFGITMPTLSRALQKCRGRLFPFGFIHLLKALRKTDRADLYLVAVKPEYKGRGVNAIMMDHLHRMYVKMGIRKAESNPNLETNAMVMGQWKFFSPRHHKRRRIFIKHLS